MSNECMLKIPLLFPLQGSILISVESILSSPDAVDTSMECIESSNLR